MFAEGSVGGEFGHRAAEADLAFFDDVGAVGDGLAEMQVLLGQHDAHAFGFQCADGMAHLLDEPSEGLAPIIVAQMAQSIRALKSEGLSVLLCEQNLRFCEAIADRAYIIEKGQIRFGGTMAELTANASLREQYLSV